MCSFNFLRNWSTQSYPAIYAVSEWPHWSLNSKGFIFYNNKYIKCYFEKNVEERVLNFKPIFLRSHRDMKILKILASNSRNFRIYGIFKKWKIGTGRLANGKFVLSNWHKIQLYKWQLFFSNLYLFDSNFAVTVRTNRLHDPDEGICFPESCCHENG